MRLAQTLSAARVVVVELCRQSRSKSQSEQNVLLDRSTSVTKKTFSDKELSISDIFAKALIDLEARIGRLTQPGLALPQSTYHITRSRGAKYRKCLSCRSAMTLGERTTVLLVGTHGIENIRATVSCAQGGGVGRSWQPSTIERSRTQSVVAFKRICCRGMCEPVVSPVSAQLLQWKVDLKSGEWAKCQACRSLIRTNVH
jgi:hypothetical protein